MTATVAETPKVERPGSSPLSDRWSQWPYFDEEQIAATVAVLRSGKINHRTGDKGRTFEVEFARACGAALAIALANATVALELALDVLGIGPGDEGIVMPRSLVASASAVAARRSAGIRRLRSVIMRTSLRLTENNRA